MPSLPSVGDVEIDQDVLVPLLLAVFVIVVTSFLATVVLDMGQAPASGQMAGVSVEFRQDADAVFVTFTSMARPDTALAVTVDNASSGATIATARLTTVGQLHIFDSVEEGKTYEVTVVAEWRDQRSLVTTRTGAV